MRAGDGILHSEFPLAPEVAPKQHQEEEEEAEGGNGGDETPPPPEIEGFQLWTNLPAERKRQPPGYQDVSAAQIPTAALAPSGSGATARVISGALLLQDGPATVVRGPARLAPPEVLLLDVRVPKGARADIPVDRAFAGFAYVYASGGGAALAGVPAPVRHALVLSDPAEAAAEGSSGAQQQQEQQHQLVAAEAGAERDLRFLLAAGKPIGEPIVQHGPFVMNTRVEIEQAFREYSAGTFVKRGRDFDPFAEAAAAGAAGDDGKDEL